MNIESAPENADKPSESPKLEFADIASPATAAGSGCGTPPNGGSGPTKKDDALASLEQSLQEERDSHMEERFVWTVVCLILVDVIWFRDSPNVTLPIVVLILELVAMMVLARRMGVEDFVSLVERVLLGFGKKGGS